MNWSFSAPNLMNSLSEWIALIFPFGVAVCHTKPGFHFVSFMKKETEAQKVWINLLDDTTDKLKIFGVCALSIYRTILLPRWEADGWVCIVLFCFPQRAAASHTSTEAERTSREQEESQGQLGNFAGTNYLHACSQRPLRCHETWPSGGFRSW